MSLSLDGTNNSNSLVGSILTGTLSTTKENDIILAFFKYAGNVQVNSIANTAGLVWTKRLKKNTSNNGACVELWYAVSPNILTADSIAATFSGAPTSPRIFSVAVNGAYQSVPFDQNSSLPNGNAALATSSLSTSISTNNPNDILFSIMNAGASGTATTIPSGFTNIFNSAGFYSLDYRIVSARQATVSETYSLSVAQDMAMLVDAVQINPVTGDAIWFGMEF